MFKEFFGIDTKRQIIESKEDKGKILEDESKEKGLEELGLANEILEDLKEADRIKIKEHQWQMRGEKTLFDLSKEEKKELIDNLIHTIKQVQGYKDLAKNEIKANPEKYIGREPRLRVLVEKIKNGNGARVAGDFFVENTQGKQQFISPCCFETGRYSETELSEKEEKEIVFWAQALARGTEKIGKKEGVPSEIRWDIFNTQEKE